MTDFIEYTAKGRYYKVYKDDVYVSQHTTEREAAQVCANLLLSDPESSVRYVHEYEVEVGLTDAGITEAQNYTPAVDQPPTIDSTPDPSSFVDGTASTYDFSTHVTDNGVSALTYALSPSIPNGLALDASTGILSLDGVTRNQGHDTTFTLTVSNDTYDVPSSPFNIVIQATSSATIVVQADGSQDYQTIQQGINAASAGDIIEVRANSVGGARTFNEQLNSVRSGTSGNYITLRGRAGDTIYITGSAGYDSVRITHDWLDWGQNLIVKGNQPYGGNNIRYGVESYGDNSIYRFNFEEIGLHTIWWRNNTTNNRATGGYTWWNGTIDNPEPGPNNGNDDGDGLTPAENTNDIFTIDRYFGYAGGHNLLQASNIDDVTTAYLWFDSLWDAVFEQGRPAETADGNRVFNYGKENNDGYVDTCIFGPAGFTYESAAQASGAVANFSSRRGIAHRLLIHGKKTGGMGLKSSTAWDGSTPNDMYLSHLTITDTEAAGVCLQGDPNATNLVDFGPWHFKNCIFHDVNKDPTNSGDYKAWRTGALSVNVYNGDWTDMVFLDNCMFDNSSVPIRIDGIGEETIGWFVENYRANFTNIKYGDPNFVNKTMPRVPHKTAWNATQFNEVFANFTPQNATAVDAGEPLTTVNGAVSNSTSVTVAEGGWIATKDKGGGFLGAEDDAIFQYYIEGHGAVAFSSKSGNALVADENVTCADGAKIWLGTSSTPNIGCSL